VVTVVVVAVVVIAFFCSIECILMCFSAFSLVGALFLSFFSLSLSLSLSLFAVWVWVLFFPPPPPQRHVKIVSLQTNL